MARLLQQCLQANNGYQFVLSLSTYSLYELFDRIIEEHHFKASLKTS